jgi:hypothetical protein
MDRGTIDELARGRREWRRAWRELPRRERRRIRFAIDRGEAVDDTRNAALAVGLARRSLRPWWSLAYGTFSGPRALTGMIVWRTALRSAIRANQDVIDF